MQMLKQHKKRRVDQPVSQYLSHSVAISLGKGLIEHNLVCKNHRGPLQTDVKATQET